jgi:hypothetical protein
LDIKHFPYSSNIVLFTCWQLPCWPLKADTLLKTDQPVPLPGWLLFGLPGKLPLTGTMLTPWRCIRYGGALSLSNANFDFGANLVPLMPLFTLFFSHACQQRFNCTALLF